MPKFKSLDDALRYVERAKEDSLRDLGKHIEDIMKEEIQDQVYDRYDPKTYDRTGQFIDSVKVTDVSHDRVEVTWRNNGDWTSYAGDPMYVIHGHEMGKVYGRTSTGYRPKTYLVEESMKRAEREVPDELIEFLRLKGIKAVKK